MIQLGSIILLNKTFFFFFQCEGQLDWKEVGNETRTLNVTLPTENIYQFAVAANTARYSSGMVWATCTILHNKGMNFNYCVLLTKVRKI